MKLADATKVTLGGAATAEAAKLDDIGNNAGNLHLNDKTLAVTGYTNQNLSGLQGTGTVNVTTTDGAVLKDSELTHADTIAIGDGTTSIDAATAKEDSFFAAKTTVKDGAKLEVTNYIDSDISGLTVDGTGQVEVTTKADATAILDETNLADATKVTLGGAATAAADKLDGIGTNAGNLVLNDQTLAVTGYTNQNLSGLQGTGTVNVTTADGAELKNIELTNADTIVIGAGAASLDVTSNDEVSFASKTTVSAGTTLSIANYINTNLSDLTVIGDGKVEITTAAGASLDEGFLADATKITLGAGASAVASKLDGLGTNAGDVVLGGNILTVTDYESENLSGLQGTGTLNITTKDGATLDDAKLTKANSITIGAGTAAIDADVANEDTFFAAKTTVAAGAVLEINNYVSSDISDFTLQAASGSTPQGELHISFKDASSDAITLADGNAKLNAATKLTVSAADTLTLQGGAGLAKLKTVHLAADGSTLSLEQDGIPFGLANITGAESGTQTLNVVTTAAGGSDTTLAYDLSNVDNVDGLDDVNITTGDSNSSEARAHILLSDTLTHSGLVDVTLDDTANANADGSFTNVDKLLFEVDMNRAVTDGTKTNWSDYGVGYVQVSNFKGTTDQFTMFDASGNNLITGSDYSGSKVDAAGSNVILINKFKYMYSDTPDAAREHIAASFGSASNGEQFSLAAFEISGGKRNLNIYQVQWNGATGSIDKNSASFESDLAVLPVAKFLDVSISDFGFGASDFIVAQGSANDINSAFS